MPAQYSGSDVMAFLSESAASDKNRFGKKGATLGLLYRECHQVAPGFLLSARTYLDHVEQLSMPPPAASSSFKNWAEQVRAQILDYPIPAGARAAAFMGTRWIPAGTKLIAQPSVVEEEPSDDSFLAQLESVANVDVEHLGNAIRTVWASAWSPRAAAYRERRGLTGLADVAVAVLVQRFVKANWAGVLLTSAPTPNDGGTVIEAVPGRGEELVNGPAHPNRYWLNNIGEIVRTDHDEVTSLDRVIGELYAVGVHLAGIFGAPQCIEWALAEGKLWVVQTRPITAGVLRRNQSNPVNRGITLPRRS